MSDRLMQLFEMPASAPVGAAPQTPDGPAPQALLAGRLEQLEERLKLLQDEQVQQAAAAMPTPRRARARRLSAELGAIQCELALERELAELTDPAAAAQFCLDRTRGVRRVALEHVTRASSARMRAWARGQQPRHDEHLVCVAQLLCVLLAGGMSGAEALDWFSHPGADDGRSPLEQLAARGTGSLEDLLAAAVRR